MFCKKKYIVGTPSWINTYILDIRHVISFLSYLFEIKVKRFQHSIHGPQINNIRQTEKQSYTLHKTQAKLKSDSLSVHKH